MTPDEILGLARRHVEHGELPRAEALYRQVLAVEADNSAAWHELGIVAFRANRPDIAVEYLRRALGYNGNVAEYHNDLGYMLLVVGDAGAAIASHRRALELQPEYAAAQNNLGLALQAMGDLSAAESAFHAALRLQPDAPWIHANLGLALQAMGRYIDAIAAYQQAIRLQPEFADAYHHLGTALQAQGDLLGAVATYQRALQLQPTYAQAHNNLGSVLQQQGDLAGAVAEYQEAIRLQPRYAHALNNLGNALRELEDLGPAIASLQEALRLDPRFPGAHNNLGLARQSAGDMAGAIAEFNEELRLSPGYIPAMINLIRPLQEVCDWPSLHALLADLERLQGTNGAANLPPTTILTLPSAPAEQLARARTWVANRYGPLEQVRAALGFDFAPTAKTKLRLGYLSSDFREHAVGYLLAEVIELHQREQFEVIGYGLGGDDGSVLHNRFVRAFDRYVELGTLPVQDAARRIYADGIDILIDLNGHTRGSRTEVVALRPAPIQVSYLGYPGTMGASFIDYILTDRFLTPPEQQIYYSERFAYLPDSYQPNDRQRPIAVETPSRSALGLPEQGLVFCCFNNAYKITPPVFEAWLRLLERTPGSVLWLVAGNTLVAGNLRREAQRRGLAPERLVFAPKQPLDRYLACYRQADLFLDTLPYNAGATASDALWAGLPVLTCTGETYVSRMAGSLLQAVGLPELVTSTLAEYETTALRLVQTPGMLAEVRARLAARRETAPLFDTPRYTRHLEDAYHAMWQAFLQQAGS